MLAEGVCHLCGIRPARDCDHKGAVEDNGPIRGFLCQPCNTKLGWVEKVGVEAIAAYLSATPIGPPYNKTVNTARRQRTRAKYDATYPGGWSGYIMYRRRVVREKCDGQAA